MRSYTALLLEPDPLRPRPFSTVHESASGGNQLFAPTVLALKVQIEHMHVR